MLPFPANCSDWGTGPAAIGSPAMTVRGLAWLVPLVVLGGCMPDEPRRDAFTATGELVALSGGDGGPTHACVTCHGIAGEGDGRDVPRLAGLDAGYLHRQIDDYANGRREHTAMRAIALRLDSDARAKVAGFYASLPSPDVADAGGTVTGGGAALYHRGDAARGLSSCASCHGVRGEGVGAGNPPLAGQSAPFLTNQLDAWRDGRRHNDPMGQMLAISRRLSPGEVDQVAAYAATLPGPGLPAVRATSQATRRDDPRNDASAQPRHEAGSSPAAR